MNIGKEEKTREAATYGGGKSGDALRAAFLNRKLSFTSFYESLQREKFTATVLPSCILTSSIIVIKSTDFQVNESRRVELALGNEWMSKSSPKVPLVPSLISRRTNCFPYRFFFCQCRWFPILLHQLYYKDSHHYYCNDLCGKPPLIWHRQKHDEGNSLQNTLHFLQYCM